MAILLLISTLIPTFLAITPLYHHLDHQKKLISLYIDDLEPSRTIGIAISVQNTETNFAHISGQVKFLEREVKWSGLFMI